MQFSCMSQLTILLEVDLPAPLPIGQVSFNSYVLAPNNLLVLDDRTDIFQALTFKAVPQYLNFSGYIRASMA